MDAPYFSDFINLDTAQKEELAIRRVKTAMFFKRYLFQKALSVFKWDMPKTWRKEYFMFCLYGRGYIAIVNTDKFGVIPQECGLYGNDVFYGPTNAIIANPLLKGTLQPRIDLQCTVIKMQPDYGSILDIVNFYGNKLLLGSESLDMNLLNSKLSFVFTAKNAKGKASFEKLYDKIMSGEPAVIQDANLLNPDGTKAWEAFEQNVGQNYIASDLLSDMRKIENMFNTAVGIPNANTDKRERMITDEANANNVETISLASTWLENLQEGCEKARNMFGIALSVDWRFPPDIGKGGKASGNDPINPGTIHGR
jgi:hypothetical protein